MSQHRIKIIISGGGTGGHIFPAVAIADALKQRLDDPDILFIGAKGRMEMEKVPAAGYSIKGLWISGIQRRLTLKNLTFPFKLISSIIKAKRIIKSFKPDLAIGTGGYASGPMLRVASRRGIPSLIQEQNSFPGITNRLLSKTVDRICVAFEGMDRYFPAEKITITGNPVRKDIINTRGKRVEAQNFFGLKEGRKTLLVIGGSQGARSINHALASQVRDILGGEVQMIWQCGKGFLPEAKEIVAGFSAREQEKLILHDFISRMDLAYAAADIVISRAGAIAISELCIVGCPIVLVPLPGAAEDHQTRNAKALSDMDAAILLPDNELGIKLTSTIKDLLGDEGRQKMMKENILQFAREDATEKIADEVIKLLERE
jgi:UDP-N-acetylglucosamine--N-acetylmuramyl-(pentapeptide) pyrophosphoryl-undecaprenol N-acetylglucosamine transferase